MGRFRPNRLTSDYRQPEQCSGKVAYSSPGAAANAAKRTMKRKSDMEVRLHPYRCNLCRKWHMGRMS